MCRSLRLRNLAGLLVALGSACAGAALAWHHPVWPLPASVMFAAWCLMVAWRPGLWLLLVPALLPLMNFSPWTGWVVFEEFDLLLLGALAGGYAPRLRMFSVSVVNAGGLADFDNLRLIDPDSTQWLDNGSFDARLAHWLPAAQLYFVPWHIDNLFVDLLVERGASGLLLLAALIAAALWRLAQGGAAVGALSAYLAASLTGALLVGLLSSIMDVPRVAFMFYLLALFSIESSPPRNRHFTPTRPLLDG